MRVKNKDKIFEGVTLPAYNEEDGPPLGKPAPNLRRESFTESFPRSSFVDCKKTYTEFVQRVSQSHCDAHGVIVNCQY